MAIVELSMTTGYVQSWTVVEAVREILQNGIDQETINPENKMEVSYAHGLLKITSALSVLDRSTLLLGSSSKSDDNRTIGKFGEGYKLALLVLCRLGYPVEILNYGRSQRWKPLLRKSRNYGGAEVLAINIERFFLTRVPDVNLTFNIYNVSEEDWTTIKSHTLQLCDVPEASQLVTEQGSILLGSEYKSQVFVNGLWVCKTDKLKYGYNFSPASISLDRDRNMVRDFDLVWLTSQMWASLWEENRELVESLIEEGAWEVQYLSSLSHSNISNSMLNRFLAKHGDKAVPVTNEDQSRSARKSGLTPVVVPVPYYESVIAAAGYSNYYLKSSTPTPHALLEEFFDKYNDQLDQEASDALLALLSLAVDWKEN